MKGPGLFLAIVVLLLIPWNPTNFLIDQLIMPFFSYALDASGAYFWMVLTIPVLFKALFAFFEIELVEDFYNKHIKEKKK
jgi:hypothetical protein